MKNLQDQKQQQKNNRNKLRRSLPPGIQEDITFGIMWIRIGNLKLIRSTKPDHNILVQFWGEESPTILVSKSNTLNKNQENTLQQYDIKCPITFFQQYLMDMKSNLKLWVEHVGKVSFDITKIIKQKVQLTDKQVFEHFKGAFDILGSHNRKVGSLEVEMSATFNPQIALRVANEDDVQQQSKQILRTPADRLLYSAQQKPSQSAFKKLNSPDIDKNLAVDILAVENPQLLKQFYQETINNKKSQRVYAEQIDNRIPNSLNTNVNRQKFQPQKYLVSNQKQSQKQKSKNNSKKSEKQQVSSNGNKIAIKTPKQYTFVDDIKQNSSLIENNFQKKQSQNLQPDNNKSPSGKKMQNFPTVQKILTYQNLKLNYFDDKQKDQPRQVQIKNKKDSIAPALKNAKKQSQSSITSQKSPINKTANLLEKQFYGLNQQQRQKSSLPIINKSSSFKDQKTKLNRALQEEALSEIQKVQRQQEDVQVQGLAENGIQIDNNEQKQILSRVVNIDEQLRKSQLKNHSQNGQSQKKIISPTKSKNQNTRSKDPSAKLVQLQKIDQQFELNKLQQKDQRNKKNVNVRQSYQQDSPNYRRTYQQQNFPQLDPITHHLESPKYQTRMTNFVKPSSLILNLLVQIQTDSIKFLSSSGSKQVSMKFNIIHKPYGLKQRIKLGPNFQNNKITIMCPVSEELVRKMDKIPFIIEFWQAVSQKFIGIIKIDLIKIKKGYMLQGRLNQTAIKTSILPTIIQRGQTNILNVSNAKSGSCVLYAAIGTSAQIQAYLNNQSKNKPTINQNFKKVSNNQQKQIFNKNFQKKQNFNTKEKDKEDNNNQQALPSKPSQPVPKMQSLFIFTQFLQYIDKNSHKYILNLAKLMKKQKLSKNQMIQFLKTIQYSSESQNDQEVLSQILIQRQEQSQNILEKEEPECIYSLTIKQSFNHFKQIKEQVLQDFIKFNYFIWSSIENNLQKNIRKQILNGATLNLIPKQHIQKLLQNHIEHQILAQYLSYLNDYVGVQLFTKYIKQIQSTLDGYEFLSLKKVIQSGVFNNFANLLIKYKKSLQNFNDFIVKNKSQFTFQQFNNYFKQNFQTNSSLWYWICFVNQQQASQQNINLTNSRSIKQPNSLLKLIAKKMQKSQAESVILQNIRSFYVKQEQIRKFNTQKRKSSEANNNNSSKNQKLQPSKHQQQYIVIQNQNNENKQNKNSQSNVIIDKGQNSQQQNHKIINNNQNQQSQVINQSNKKPLLKKHLEHSFSLKGVQLFLQFPFNGQCTIAYYFPNEQQAINSKKIKLYDNKHRYSINLYGQHKFVIEGDITTYLNQTPIKFSLFDSENKIFLQGALHPDQLLQSQLLQNQNQHQHLKKQTKIVPLFNQDVQKMQGKIKIQCEYEVKQTLEETIGKQTVYNLFLPKSGYVNFKFVTRIQEQKIKQQYRLSQEYYIIMSLDLFAQDKNLKSYHPALSSKLFSDFDQELEFIQSVKLSLNPVVLEYFKTKSALISLNLIYYSKERGNYEKKEHTFATIKIPFLNLIKNDGIQGNFAFKNKYGMFMALCNTLIRYEKQQKVYSNSNANSGVIINNHYTTSNFAATKEQQKKANHFWIVVQFLQWINFQNRQQEDEISSIRFQMVSHGKKYQSSKVNLSDQPFNSINSQSFTLALTEEQFTSIKILPISIITNKKQKLAIDIDLKPINKNLFRQNQRYTANSGYFLVVDQQSRLKKIRVGARVVTFKGNYLLQNFVQSFCSNLDLDIVTEMDLPKDLGNYNKMLEIFKTNLKLSKRSFEDSLSMLLGLGGQQKRQKLRFQLMSCQILHKLDLTPLVCQSQEYADRIGQELPSTISPKKLLQYIKQNQIQITNLRDQILQRFTFKELDNKLDKNIQFLGLQKQVDVITFIRKVKIYNTQQFQGQNNNSNNTSVLLKDHPIQLKITLLKGSNLHLLYNGIKPNVMIRFPQIGFQSTVKSRSGDPLFNETFRQILKMSGDQKNISLIYRRLRVQAYHVSVQSSQEILIGQGEINLLAQISTSVHDQLKTYKIFLNSTMSSKMKAVLQISVQTSLAKLNTTHHQHNNSSSAYAYQDYYNQNQNDHNKTDQIQESLQDASKIQQMIKGMNRQLKGKQYMFQSSDDQY